jgi:hypothetical protein
MRLGIVMHVMRLQHEWFTYDIRIHRVQTGEFTYELIGEEADYLPKAMQTFAEFLRACGYGWVTVKQIDGERIDTPVGRIKPADYLFSGDYALAGRILHGLQTWYNHDKSFSLMKLKTIHQLPMNKRQSIRLLMITGRFV